MPQVKIVKKEVEIEQEVRLNNGDLIAYGINVAIVVSNPSGATYCSIIDLQTGSFVCKERCSRSTTRKRIGAHIRNWATGYRSYSSIQYNKIEIYKKNQYDVSLEIKVAAQSMCHNAVYASNMDAEIEVKPQNLCPHCGEPIEVKAHTVTALSIGEEETYAEWFKCESCGCIDITKDSNYCPGCGGSLAKENKEGK